MDELYLVEPWSGEMFYALYASFILHTIGWIAATIRKDNGLIDLFWPLSYVV